MNKNKRDLYPGHHTKQVGADTNKLRAAVLGANDGIVSVASIVVGVAGVANSTSQITTAGVAGLVAGAFSMAVGEYVSVSSQRDTERVLLRRERRLIEKFPEEEFEELASLYEAKGLSHATALQVASELTKNDVHAAHFDAELGIDPHELTNPWAAALASSLAFTAGGVVPLATIIFVTKNTRIPATFLAVIAALFITGILSAKASGASKRKASIRVIIGGLIAMSVTFLVGRLLGAITL